MSEKEEKLKDSLSQIKSNTLIVIKNLEKLKLFNYKLECLLKANEVFREDTFKVEEIGNLVSNEVSESLNSKSLLAKAAPPIEKITSTNKYNSELEHQLFDIINNQRSICLEDLVKKLKISKYKVLEVVNNLIKEEKVCKEFDKRTFIYKINKS